MDFAKGAPHLMIYSAADRQVREFAVGGEADFSPDGKWIAYIGPGTVAFRDVLFNLSPVPGRVSRCLLPEVRSRDGTATAGKSSTWRRTAA